MGPLTANDWVKAALRLLGREGAELVRVEPLAKELKVTKGSFYWHFKDRAALRAAVLAEWERVATSAVIDVLEAGGGTAREKLGRLFQIATAHPEAARIEQAVRAWGASVRSVRSALRRVDARREGYVRELLMACGVPERRASVRCRALYLMLIGEYAVVTHGGERTPDAVWEEQLALATHP